MPLSPSARPMIPTRRLYRWPWLSFVHLRPSRPIKDDALFRAIIRPAVAQPTEEAVINRQAKPVASDAFYDCPASGNRRPSPPTLRRIRVQARFQQSGVL